MMIYIEFNFYGVAKKMRKTFTQDNFDFLKSKFKNQIDRYKFLGLDYEDKCEYVIFMALSNKLESPLYFENDDFYDVDTDDRIYDDDANNFDHRYDILYDVTITEYADLLNTEQTDFKDKIFKE